MKISRILLTDLDIIKDIASAFQLEVKCELHRTDTLEAALEGERKRCLQLKNDFDCESEIMSNLQKESLVAVDKAQALQEDLNNARGKCIALEVALHDEEEKIIAFQEQAALSQGQISALQTDLSCEKGKWDALQLELSRERKNIQLPQSDNDQERQHSSVLQHQVQTAEEKLVVLQDQVRQLTMCNGDQERQDRQNEEFCDQRERITRLRTELDSETEKGALLKRELESERKMVHEFSEKIALSQKDAREELVNKDMAICAAKSALAEEKDQGLKLQIKMEKVAEDADIAATAALAAIQSALVFVEARERGRRQERVSEAEKEVRVLRDLELERQKSSTLQDELDKSKHKADEDKILMQIALKEGADRCAAMQEEIVMLKAKLAVMQKELHRLHRSDPGEQSDDAFANQVPAKFELVLDMELSEIVGQVCVWRVHVSGVSIARLTHRCASAYMTS